MCYLVKQLNSCKKVQHVYFHENNIPETVFDAMQFL